MVVDQMDIKSLRYFLAVVSEGNITRAAQKLCMAQPPLTRQLRLLEEELGVTLFLRGKRRIQLTEEGRFLKQQAEEIILLLEKTEQQLASRSSEIRGIVSIGATETCGAGLLSGLIGSFHRQIPGVRFQIWSGNGDETRDRIEKNLVDMGIVREPFNMENYDRVFLKQEPWIAVMSRDHPLARKTKDTIELSQLGQEPLMIPIREPIQNEINNWFNEIAAERNIFCMFSSHTSVIGLVENNQGIAICAESAKSCLNAERFAFRKIVRPEHVSRIFLVKKRFQVMSTASNLFWEHVRNNAQNRTV